MIKTLGNNQAATVGLGDQVTYTITVANQGNVPSLGYTVEDRLPLGVRFVSASDGGVFDGDRTVDWTLSNLDPGQQKSITLVVETTDATLADYRNWAEISSDSSGDYNTTDEDSTPDSSTGNDSVAGLGGTTGTNDDVINHNDISLDNPPGDEDDNDFEDVSLEVNYDLALIKTLEDGQANPVALGETVTYVITVANQGNVPSNTIEIEDRLPLGVSFVSASGGGVFDGDRTVNWTINNIDPQAQRTRTLVVRVEDATLGGFRNWAEISNDSASDFGTTDEDSTPDDFTGNDSEAGFGGITTNDDAVNHNDITLDEPANDEDDNDFEDVDVLIEYDLALIKTLANGQSAIVTPGETVTYTITVANQGNVPSNAYDVLDRIPLGTSFVSASDNGTANGRDVTWTGLTSLDPGQVKSISLVLRIDDATRSPYRNWAEITGDGAATFGVTDEDSTPDGDVGAGSRNPNDAVDNHNDITLDEPAGDEDDNDFEDVEVNVEYDLALIKTLAAGQSATVGLGDLVEYTITIANQGNVPSEPFDVADQIPAGMGFVSASNGGVAGGNTVSWSALASLNPGATSTLSLVLRVEDATLGDYRNWAEITSDGAAIYGTTDEDSTPDPNTGNDNAAGFGNDPNDPFNNHNDITLDEPAGDEDDNDFEDVAVDVEYDLALIKTLASGQANPIGLGDLVSYSITVANQGNVPSNSYVVADQIPAGMSFVSASAGGTESGGVVTWSTLPSLNAGATQTLSLVLRVDDATTRDYRNWAEIISDSASDFGVTDEDSTPDSNTGNDNADGTGTDPNDPFTNHNDITLDEPAGDEDDNDFEDIALEINYDLALIKTLGAGQATTVSVGDLVTYNITVTNQGNVPSNDYTVTDLIPAGMSFISASDSGTMSNGVVTWSNLANLAPGATKTLSLILRVDDATQSEYRNLAEISEDSASDFGTTDEDSTPDVNLTNDPMVNHNDQTLDDPAGDEDDNDFEDITVLADYDLALIKTLAPGQPSSVTVGETVDFNITVTNQGNVPSNSYSVVDVIPPGMGFVSASDGGTMSNGVVTWSNLANIAPGASKTLTITLSMDDATVGEYINRAEISEDSASDFGTTDEDSTPDSNVNNDPVVNHNDPTLDDPTGDEDDNDLEEVQVGIEYDLALIKTLSGGQSAIVEQGDNVSYDITIANQGNVESLTYSVVDHIPAGMSFVSATDGGVMNNGMVMWTDLANIPVGGTKVLTLVLQVTDVSQGDFRNWAEISEDSSSDYNTSDDDSTPDMIAGDDNGPGTGTDPNDPFTNHNDITLDNPSGDEDDNDFEDVQAQVSYDLALVKTLGEGQPATVQIGEVVVYDITIANQGNVPSNGFTVIDQIPAGMSVLTTSDNGTVNGNTITWNISNLAPGAIMTLNLILRVDDASQGDYRNWAEIASDSSSDFGTTDEDSTPDSNTGDDNAPGLGTDPNDAFDNHNDISLDEPANDEDDSDFEDVEINVSYDLSLAKALADGRSSTVSLGEVVDYTITILNQGNVPSNDYQVTDYLPAGMEFVAASDFGSFSGNTVTWSNLSNLAPNQSKTLTLSLRVVDAAQAPFENFAEISDDSSEDYGVTDEDSTPDTDPTNDDIVETDDPTPDTIPGDEDDSDPEVVDINVSYDLSLVKALADGQSGMVGPGDVVNYTITILNQGNVPSNTYEVSDFIPAGMSFISASDFGSMSNGVVTWSNLTSLAPGQTKTLIIALRVEDVTQAPFENFAEISDDSSEDFGTTDEDSTPDDDPTNDDIVETDDPTPDTTPGDEDDSDIEVVEVNVSYDLSLAKALADGQSATVSLGEVVNYTITILNQGNVPSNDYTVADFIPAGMSFVSASDFGSMTNGVVTWSKLSSLAPGVSKTLTVSLRVEDVTQAPFENFAEITEDSSEDFGTTDEDSTPDNDPTNDDVVETDDPTPDTIPGDEDDSDPEVVDVNVSYDLSLAKALADGQDAMVGPGDVVNFTITVLNQGNVPSNDYSVTDFIPAGMSFVSASDFGSVSGNMVTWSSLSNLDPGQSKTLIIALRVEDVAQAPFENFAEISDDSSEDYGTTDEDSTPDTDPTNDDVVETDDPTPDTIPGDEDDSDPEVVDVNVNYDLALVKALAPDQSATVTLGEVVNYAITIANQGNVPSGTYDIADYIPAGMEFISASDFGTLNGTTVNWTNLASLAPGEEKTILLILRVVDASQAPFENFAEITNDSADDFGTTDEDSTPDTNPSNDDIVETDDPSVDNLPGDEDDSDIEIVDVNVIYDLALIKTLAGNQSSNVSVGEVVNYNIIIANQGNVPSNEYSVIDQIPAGMEFIGASDGGSNANGTVTWADLSNLDPGQTKTLSLSLQVVDLTQGDFRNWAEISDDSAADFGVTDEDSTPDSNTGNDNTSGTGTAPNDLADNHNDISLDDPANDEDDNDFEDVSAEITYDLALVKALADGQTASVSLGDIVDYTITIANQGNVPSNDYSVADVIPAGMEYVTSSDFGSLNGNVVTWTSLSSLDAGQTKTLTISLRVVDASLAPYVNFAEITDDSSEDFNVTDEDSTPDTNPTNDPLVETDDSTVDMLPGDEDDSDIEPVDVNVVYDLALVKTLAEGQSSVVNVGDVVAYNITIANQGNVPSNGYTVIDQLPTGLGYIAASDGGTASGNLVTWSDLPSLAPGQTTTLTLTAQVQDGLNGDYRNWAEISEDSAADFGVSDEDSTPDDIIGIDDTDGFGSDPNDLFIDHNDITLDDPAGDEDDSDFEDVTLQPIYDLALVKLLNTAPDVAEGDIVSYSIIVTNQGTVPSNDYVVSDFIPDGMSFVAAPDGGTESGGVVTWSNLPSLDPGMIQVLTLILTLDDATLSGDYRNWAEITEDSASDFGVTDEDSTPDTDPNNDPVVNHNDPAADTVVGDEDDNDFEDVFPILPPPVYDLALIKTIAAGQPTSLATGDQVTYEITITNQGDVASNDYSVIDEIPAGMSFVTASNGGNFNGGIVMWSQLNNLDPGQTMVLTITLQMDDPTLSSYRNWAEISDDSSEDFGVTDEDSTPDDNVTNDPVNNHNDPTADTVAGDEDDNDYEDVTAILPPPVYDLALIKVLANGQSSELGIGDQATYSILVTNQGDVASNDYSVSDVIPAGMSYVSASDFGSHANGVVTWSNLANLDPGQTKVLSITLQMDDPTLGTTYTNFAEIIDDSSEDFDVTDEDSTPDSDPDNDPIVDHNDPAADMFTGDEDDSDIEVITPILPEYDLALIKTIAPGQVTTLAEGDQITYNITIINQGEVASNDYSVADYIPTGMSYVSSTDGGSHNAGIVTWSSLPNIAPGQTMVLAVTLQMDDATLSSYRNWAEITDDSAEDFGVTDEDSTPDLDPDNDAAVNHNDQTADNVAGDEDDNDYEDITPIVPPAPVYDLALIKVLANGQSSSVGAGEQVSYNIIVTNQGTVASNDYSVTDVIPAGMSYVSASDGGSHNNGIVTWMNLSNLNPGETKVLTITLQMDDPTLGTAYNNFAEISDDSSEDFGVSDEDSTPDLDPTNDPTVDHNDPTADTVTGDEDDSDIEPITPIVPAPVYDLALIKTLAGNQSTSIFEGDEVAYEITITNQGEVPSNDYTVVDQIPAGMSFVSASDNPTQTGNIVTWANLPNIDPGQSHVLTIVLRLDDASFSNYRNIAEITEDSAADYGTEDEDSTTDADLTNDIVINHNDPTADEVVGDEDDNDFEDFAPIQVSFVYDLALVKMLADGQESSVGEGGIVVYNIFVSNQGSTPSNDYEVTDIIPEGMGFVAASHSATENNGVVTWTNLPNIDPGQTEVLVLTLELQDASIGSYVNFAEISDDSSEDFDVTDEDSTPDNNSNNDPIVNHNDVSADNVTGDEDDSDIEAVTSIQPVPVYDLALVKTIESGQGTSLSVGDEVTYSIIVTNQGTVPSNDYCVVDVIPAGMSFVSASDNGDYEDGLVNWIDLPNINPGQTEVLSITLRMDDTSLDTYRNFAEISIDSAEDYGVNDEDSSPDGNVNNDEYINHNDPTADIINGDEDDSDFEDVSSNPQILLLIDCPDDLVIACGDDTDPASLGQATATTNCTSGEVSITFEDRASAGGCGDTFVRIWTAIDFCGGINQCEQLITVVDDVAPVVFCAESITVDCGDALALDIALEASATDNCSARDDITIVFEDSGDLANCGSVTRTWIATDACGNIGTCNQVITSSDEEAPIISCPQDITINCEQVTAPSGTGGLATATDNCSSDISIEYVDQGDAIDCETGGAILREFTATDGCGNFTTCKQVISVAPVIVEPSCEDFSISVSDDITICSGSTAQLNVSGGVSYSWSPASSLDNPNSASPAASPAVSTTYTVVATRDDGCQTQAQVTVIVDSDPAVSAGIDQVICAGESTQLNATGGVIYSWSPASGLSDPTIANPTVTINGTTTYTVVATNTNGCQGTSSVTISIGTPTITASGGKSICSNTNEFAQLAASGGVSYSWAPATGLDNPFSANPIATPSTTTNYVVTGTDANGCTARAEVTVVVNGCGTPVDPCANFTIVDHPDRSICAGNTTQLNASGGISYAWGPTTGLDNPSSANPLASPTATTTYTVTVTSAEGCIATDQITVQVTGGIVVNAGPDITFFASCPGEPITGAQLNATGGVFYEWSPAAGLNSTSIPNPIATPSGPTTYTVTVTNQSGCSGVDQVTVQVATPTCLPSCDGFSIPNQPDQTICSGSSTQLTASGGILYFWDPTAGLTDPTLATQVVSPTGTTTYTVTVTDVNGCTATDQIRVVVESCPDPFSDIDGDGISDAIELQLGTNPADPCSNNYSADELCNFIANNPNSSLASADCDNGGISNSEECIAGRNPLFQGDDNIGVGPGPGNCSGFVIYECPDKRICVGGTAQLVVNGGTSWVWSPAIGLNDPFSDVPTASPPTTTTYTVVGTDANGCTASEEVVVTVMSELKVYGGEDQTICGGQVAQLDGQGGVRYQWSPATGLSNPNIANPTANPSTTTTYTVTVTNPMGCTGTDQVTITAGGNISANAGPDQTVCAGQPANLRATGGLIYRWSPTTGLSNSTISNPTATPSSTTTYMVTVTDVDGCTGTDQVTVRVENNITVSAGNDATICSGQNVQLNASGGASYQWSPSTGLSNPNINNPMASPGSTTIYTVMVTDVNGCTGTDQVTVTVRNNISVNASSDVTVCNGQGTQLNATAPGGASYQWSPSTGLSNAFINNPMASPSLTTVYTVTVTDVNGCTGTDNVTVTVGNFVAEACEDKEICAGESTRLLVSAGSTYQWSPAASLDNPNIAAPNASPSSTTTYTVTVTGPNGCTSVDQVILYVQTNTSANAGPDINECPGVGTQLRATGGMSYEWNPKVGLDNPFSATPFANPSTTTTYTVSVMDFNGCIATDEMVYTVSSDCTPPVNCDQGLVDVSEACVEEDNFARVCLPFSISDVAANFTLTTSSGTVVSNHGCDFVPVYAYTYAILPNMGGSGTYLIESWVVNGNTYTGEVSNMAELTAWMQSIDPAGNWLNNAASYFILGGTPDGVYGDLIIMHEETWITTTLNTSQTGQASGTLVEIDMTNRENDVLTITNNVTGCTDQVTLRTCTTAPRCPENLVEETYDLTITECSEMAPLCLPFNADHMEDYDILVDGNPYEGIIEVCTSVTSFAYTYFSIPDQGAKGPYQISKWTVNDNVYNGSFNNLEELLEWMNIMDPKGKWTQDATTLSIRGGVVTNTYGKLEIIQTFTRSKAILDINTKTSPNSVQLAFAEGNHAISFYNSLNGCSDEFAVNVGCINNRVPRAAGDAVEIDGEEEAILDLTANDRADEITIEITKAPQHGEAVINADNTVSYEANDGYCNSKIADHFAYRICNEFGCDEAEVEVLIKCPAMEVVSGFSPNNDGINDYLTIKGLQNYPANELVIFNRWGTEIFKQKGYDGEWDGTFDGLPLTDGTYFYILKDGEGNTQSGYVQINR